MKFISASTLALAAALIAAGNAGAAQSTQGQKAAQGQEQATPSQAGAEAAQAQPATDGEPAPADVSRTYTAGPGAPDNQAAAAQAAAGESTTEVQAGQAHQTNEGRTGQAKQATKGQTGGSDPQRQATGTAADGGEIHPLAITCRDIVDTDVKLVPQLVYWIDGYNLAYNASTGQSDIDPVVTVAKDWLAVPAKSIITACKAEPTRMAADVIADQKQEAKSATN